MAKRKQLRKMMKRENSIALKELVHPTKQKKHRTSEQDLFAEIDERMEHKRGE